MEEMVPTPTNPIVPSEGAATPIAPAAVPMICPQCHQPVLPTFYFCPNCGKKVNEPALSTSLMAQVWLYAFSIALPIICYLAIGYWQGLKYFKSEDPKAKQMGTIAIALILLSTVITFWLGVVWIESTVQSAMTSVGNINSFGNTL